MTAVATPIIKEMLEAGVHFGHQTNRWNPKMRRWLYGARNGTHIINLRETARLLEEARDFVRTLAAQGGTVLFVGTKRQAQDVVEEVARRTSMVFVNQRWLGGTLTNFRTIQKSVDRFKRIEQMREDGTFEQLSKKEVAQLEHEHGKLRRNLSGIIAMETLPDAVFIVDTCREDIAIREATRLKIPIVAMLDSNADPDPITYPIPANDDAIRSVRLITEYVAEAAATGRQAFMLQHPEQFNETPARPAPKANTPIQVAEVAAAVDTATPDTPADSAEASPDKSDAVVASGVETETSGSTVDGNS